MAFLVDSGADQAVFRLEIATLLGIDYKTGQEERTHGVGGETTMWVHTDFGLALKDKQGNKIGVKLKKVAFTRTCR